MTESHATPAGPGPVGQYLTLTDAETGRSEAYVFVADRGDDVAVMPMLPDRPLPPVGQRVACVSSAGFFDTTVRRIEGSTVLLAVPEWARRDIRRAALRVPASAPVHLDIGGRRWSGRLADVSVSGGSVLTEAAAAPAIGAVIGIAFPQGSGTAAVRSVRPHEHELLVAVGVSWVLTDPAADDWLHARVESARQRPAEPTAG